MMEHIMSSSIQCVRLVTGEDLIAEVEIDNETKMYKLSNPLMILLTPSQKDNRMNLSLLPFMGFAKERVFEYNRRSIMTVFAPNEKLEDEYRKVFGKVVVARPSLVGLDGVAGI